MRSGRTVDEFGRQNNFAIEPQVVVAEADSTWGFHDRAEKLNGRLAMVGFVALLLTEAALGQGLLPFLAGGLS